jgi:preprotein translocase subunit SecG
MRLLLFVCMFGILVSVAVLIVVLMVKTKRDDTPPKIRGSRDDN